MTTYQKHNLSVTESMSEILRTCDKYFAWMNECVNEWCAIMVCEVWQSSLSGISTL